MVHVSEMATPAQESSYRLSAELTGHSGDVRAVTGFRLEDCDADYVVTTSRDKTARVWVREGREFKTVKIIGQHTGYVSAVCVIPADSDAGRSQREKTVRYALQITKLHFFSYPSALIVTAGQDTNILIHSFDKEKEGS